MKEQDFGVVEQRTWQVVTKNQEGEAQVHDLLYERKLPELRPEEFERLFVTQAPPSQINSTELRRPARKDKLTALMPDCQIGWLGEQPFHDQRAMDLGRLAVRRTQPSEIVIMGDLMDFPSVSKYDQRHEWSMTVQKTIDTAHQYLAGLRADVPDAKMVMLAGNHEQRLENYIRKNASELLGLKRANASELSVLTLPYLLRLGELGINYLPYPNGRYWIQPNIQALHGTTTGKSGQTASRLLNGATASVAVAHAHRHEIAYKTIDEYQGARTIWGMVVGSFCRNDSSVPNNSLTTDPESQLVAKPQNWQQGMSFIESNERVSFPTLAPITEKGIYVYGRNYTTPS